MMWVKSFLTRTGMAFLCLIAAKRAVADDTIVLKNGRRIVALTAVVAGDKVRYQTTAGELTLPRSIVDHIESGALQSAGMGVSRAANLAIAPPAMESNATSAAVESEAVHDGAIDRNFLGRLELEARSGGREANDKAAMALHAAAQFELSRGDMEHALVDERAALTYAQDDPLLL